MLQTPLDTNRSVAGALARVAPGLPAPPPPPWARLCEPPGLEQAIREAGFAKVAVHEVTHARDLGDAADFFRHLPEYTPPLRPLFASLSRAVIGDATEAFAELVRQHSMGEGLPQTALIGIGSRPPLAPHFAHEGGWGSRAPA
jgi:hypothetical protein